MILDSGIDSALLVRSKLWQFNSVGVSSGGEAVVIDPGITPEEIDELKAALQGARVTTVILTHSHHDHIRGWKRFEGARVVMPRVAAEKGAVARTRILAAKAKIDERLGVEDPGFDYPLADEVFDDRTIVTCGDLTLELRFLPGHSNCTSVVWIEELRTLLTADYAVSPGLPYCRWNAAAFVQAQQMLLGWVDTLGVEHLIPSHRELYHGSEAIKEALTRDLDYMLELRRQTELALEAGRSDEEAVREATRAIREWRGEDLGKREIQDVDNAQRTLAALRD